jgi:hypothetical protein
MHVLPWWRWCVDGTDGGRNHLLNVMVKKEFVAYFS